MGRKAIRLKEVIKEWQECLNAIESCNIPVIMGVHGNCVGGGIDMILAGDIRYCT